MSAVAIAPSFTLRPAPLEVLVTNHISQITILPSCLGCQENRYCLASVEVDDVVLCQ
jgi:hypothetical protein